MGDKPEVSAAGSHPWDAPGLPPAAKGPLWDEFHLAKRKDFACGSGAASGCTQGWLCASPCPELGKAFLVHGKGHRVMGLSVTTLDELSAPDGLEQRLEGCFQTKGGGYRAGGIRGVSTSTAFRGGCCARGRGMMRAAGHGRVLPCRAAAQPKEAKAKLQDAGKISSNHAFIFLPIIPRSSSSISVPAPTVIRAKTKPGTVSVPGI